MQPVASGTWVPLAQAIDAVIDRLRPLGFRNREDIAMRKMTRRAVVSALAAGAAIAPAVPDAATAAVPIPGEELEMICRAAEHYNAAEAAQGYADESTPEGAARARAYDEASDTFFAVAEAVWREPIRGLEDLLKRAMVARVGHARSDRQDRLAIGIEDMGLFDRADYELAAAVLALLDQGAFGAQVTDRLARAD